MERKLYPWILLLLGVAGIALAMHVLRIKDSIPATVKLYGRAGYSYSVSRDFYVRAIFLDAFLLPVVCGVFALVAHAGREIDMVSWFFVAGFYLAFWWLGWQVDHLQPISGPQTGAFFFTNFSNPLSLLAFAIGTGLGFWKWKQDWSSGIQ